MEPLDEEILRAARDLPGIAVLVVFGSRAQGTPRPDSDLDVAVLPDTADSRARRHLQADLAVALAHLAPEGRVDVVLLDEVPDLAERYLHLACESVLDIAQHVIADRGYPQASRFLSDKPATGSPRSPGPAGP